MHADALMHPYPQKLSIWIVTMIFDIKITVSIHVEKLLQTFDILRPYITRIMFILLRAKEVWSNLQKLLFLKNEYSYPSANSISNGNLAQI